jgi:hypothetical protein
MKFKDLEKHIKAGQNVTNKQLRRYYNYKYPRQTIIYNGRAMPGVNARMPIDVRLFAMSRCPFIKEAVKACGISKTDSNDVKILKIQNWVVNILQYVDDRTRTGFTEYFQFPFETVFLKTGDCEDGAILILSLALAAKIPNFRIRISAGMVEYRGQRGGHAYVTYLRESDNKWVPIDWCYLPDHQVATKDKKLLKNNDMYREVWFSFNDTFSWGRNSMTFEKLEKL